MWTRCFNCSAWQQIIRDNTTDASDGYCSRYGVNQRSYDGCNHGDEKEKEEEFPKPV